MKARSRPNIGVTAATERVSYGVWKEIPAIISPARYIGARVPRKEGPRLLTGRGAFVDDLHLPGMLHAMARARAAGAAIVGLAVPHVVRAFTGSDHRWLLPYCALLGPVLDGDVDVFVANGHDKKVHILQRDTLEVLTSFGDGGRQPGQFYGVHSIAIDSRDRIFVADRTNNRVQIFDKGLEHQRTFGSTGSSSISLTKLFVRF